MKYDTVREAIFLSRPNRFIAYVEINGVTEKVHVKNTGRCKELLVPGAKVYLYESDNPERSTKYDLIAVEKGSLLINMDSQAPNAVVKEALEAGKLIPGVRKVCPETTYGDSRFDFFVETEDNEKGLFIEVKGVTLERDGICAFPDAPSDRAVKHIRELMKAKEEGYGAMILLVVQIKGMLLVTPNTRTQPEFTEALLEAEKAGVEIRAAECTCTPDTMEITGDLPVVLSDLAAIVPPLMRWYHVNRRILPWREDPTPYHVWLSEIMLQQTRVEAVKPYYERFLASAPDIASLAALPEEELLKLWEGLGYYSRVRNLQKAAVTVMERYAGELPSDYEELQKLSGIGSYTAGAISSIAYGKCAPAVDGNVLRIVARLRTEKRSASDPSFKKELEGEVPRILPEKEPGLFNQAMMDLGATVCLPNGTPKCEECPIAFFCRAKEEGKTTEYPVKEKKKPRRQEKKTVLVLTDETRTVLHKRPEKGLLAGLYEFPALDGTQSRKAVLEYLKEQGIIPLKIEPLGEAKHIFSHVEWHMTGYRLQLDSLAKMDEALKKAGWMLIEKREIEDRYPLPSAFGYYADCLRIRQGADKLKGEK